MSVRVNILERDFISGELSLHHRVFHNATTFDVYFNETQEDTHLKVLCEEKMIAFYPAGSWMGVEIIKE